MKQNYTQIPEHIYARCIFMLLLFNQYISNKKKKTSFFDIYLLICFVNKNIIHTFAGPEECVLPTIQCRNKTQTAWQS